MTNHLAMWHYWMLRDRNRSNAQKSLVAGQTPAEQAACDQPMDRLRAAS